MKKIVLSALALLALPAFGAQKKLSKSQQLVQDTIALYENAKEHAYQDESMIYSSSTSQEKFEKAFFDFNLAALGMTTNLLKLRNIDKKAYDKIKQQFAKEFRQSSTLRLGFDEQNIDKLLAQMQGYYGSFAATLNKNKEVEQLESQLEELNKNPKASMDQKLKLKQTINKQKELGKTLQQEFMKKYEAIYKDKVDTVLKRLQTIKSASQSSHQIMSSQSMPSSYSSSSFSSSSSTGESEKESYGFDLFGENY